MDLLPDGAVDCLSDNLRYVRFYGWLMNISHSKLLIHHAYLAILKMVDTYTKME
jgi:hypothetical protein